MPARKQLWHHEETKKRIQASQLINRLQKHALSDEPIMDASQVTAAFKLLGKVLPDLKASEITGELTGRVTVTAIERIITSAAAPVAIEDAEPPADLKKLE